MSDYHFRTLTPDGRIVFETTSPAKSLGDAIAFDLKTAGDVKSRHPAGTGCSTWFVDILDQSGCWLMSVPLAMATRNSDANRVA